MIRSKDLNKELKILDDKVKKESNSVSNADVVKAVTLVAKLLRDVRTNQVKIMQHEGITLVAPEAGQETGEDTTKGE